MQTKQFRKTRYSAKIVKGYKNANCPSFVTFLAKLAPCSNTKAAAAEQSNKECEAGQTECRQAYKFKNLYILRNF